MKKEDIYKPILSSLLEFKAGDSLKLTYEIFINFKEGHYIDEVVFPKTVGNVLTAFLKSILEEDLISFLVSLEAKGVQERECHTKSK